MAKVKLYNRHTSPIDGVAPGAQGEWDDCPGVRGMFERGLLSSDPPPAAGAPSNAAEVAELKAALDAAHASYEAQLSELRAALEAARAKPKKGASAPADPPAEG